ncbi:hypothetical protein ACJRO7_002259 [Eucalyptus globulus]|uniref:Strictosidine synthase conserved region domain-containing protein n=1 Tax=Eucalyptus globulus TaxID=34317 RepID=A0ABD3LUW0_EUCGL
MASSLGAAATALAVVAVVPALNLPAHLLRLPSREPATASTLPWCGGGPYTGVTDGRVLKREGDERWWVDFAFTSSRRKECVRPFAPELEHVCGRPLGLHFDKKTGDLYIADAYFGLMAVGPDGGLATLVANEAEGEPFRFMNDLDIGKSEDLIYFTDSSTTFHRRHIMNAFLSGGKTGRLLKYNKCDIILFRCVDSILFELLLFSHHRVALSKDSLFLLVAESAAGRILRLWLEGPNAGKLDIFAELPSYPDNIRRNSGGELWVALDGKKGPFLRFLLSDSRIGNFALGLPVSLQRLHSMLVGGKAESTAVKLGKEGEILEVVQDKEGKAVQFISEVEERDDKVVDRVGDEAFYRYL